MSQVYGAITLKHSVREKLRKAEETIRLRFGPNDKPISDVAVGHQGVIC